jgi:osmotically-inducible protein OsmY
MVAIILGLSQVLSAQNQTRKLESRVLEELERYYPEPFKVTVKDSGEVIITGRTSSFWDKLNVYSIVARVPGVRKISDLVEVETEMVPDKTIKLNIENELALNNAIEDPKKIQVAVDKGDVILGGTVNFQREATMAEDVASWIAGVRSVANGIQVLPPQKAVSDSNLTVILKDLMSREFSRDERTISIHVQQGRVILKGTVPTLWARDHIEKEFKRVQGVLAVENQLKIVHPGEMEK